VLTVMPDILASMPATNNEPLQIGDWLVDPRDDSLTRGADRVKIEPRTMRLLMRLAKTPGAVVSQEELLESVWTGVVVGTASIYQSMSQLRKVLGDSDDPPRYIETVARKGYRLIARVSSPAAVQAAAGTTPAFLAGTPADGNDPQLAERDGADPRSVRRQRETEEGARGKVGARIDESRRRQVPRGSRHAQMRAEFDRCRRSAARVHPPQLAVRRVEERRAVARPAHARRRDVSVRGQSRWCGETV